MMCGERERERERENEGLRFNGGLLEAEKTRRGFMVSRLYLYTFFGFFNGLSMPFLGIHQKIYIPSLGLISKMPLHF